MNKKIHPSVEALVKPIIHEMTKIDLTQQYNPMIGAHNENEFTRERKKECVHITFDGNDYKLRTEKTEDGKVVCAVCGREINTTFDNSAVETLLEANKVINQVLLFGMLNGLRAEPIAALISMKKLMPSVAQLCKELNEYVKQTENTSDSLKNIGAEYDSSFNITGL